MENKQKAIVFLNGKKPSKKLLSKIDFSHCLTIAADGAYDYARNFCNIDILLGDFDSLKLSKDKIAQNTKIISFDKDKDYTDGYLAILEAKKQGASDIEIYGAFGKRIDHEYNNYSLLNLALEYGISAVLKDEIFDAFLVSDEIKMQVKKGATVSLVPFGSRAHILSTKGLLFGLSDFCLEKENTANSVMGISNSAATNFFEVKVKNHDKVLVFVERG